MPFIEIDRRSLQSDAERGPVERLRRLFSQFADPAATLLDALDNVADIHVSMIEEVALDSWMREHVVLIDDAAHATSPNIAHGAAMAHEDALVLASCLPRPACGWTRSCESDGVPDIGCFSLGGEPLRVGVDAGRSFPLPNPEERHDG